MDDTKDEDLFKFVGVVSDDDAPELLDLASGLGLDSCTGEVQGSDEWNAGGYESI